MNAHSMKDGASRPCVCSTAALAAVPTALLLVLVSLGPLGVVYIGPPAMLVAAVVGVVLGTAALRRRERCTELSGAAIAINGLVLFTTLAPSIAFLEGIHELTSNSSKLATRFIAIDNDPDDSYVRNVRVDGIKINDAERGTLGTWDGAQDGRLPRTWSPDVTVQVSWERCTPSDIRPRPPAQPVCRTVDKVVPVRKYEDRALSTFVHLLPDDEVALIPWDGTPSDSDYPGPKPTPPRPLDVFSTTIMFSGDEQYVGGVFNVFVNGERTSNPPTLSLPWQWRPGLSASVKWQFCREEKPAELKCNQWRDKVVPVGRYGQLGPRTTLYLKADGDVQLVNGRPRGSVTVMDHDPSETFVRNVYVNGTWVGPAETGDSFEDGGISLPNQWRLGLTAVVRWERCEPYGKNCRWTEKVVPIHRYDEVGPTWLHILEGDKVLIIPSMLGPGHPDYPGPNFPTKDFFRNTDKDIGP